MCVFTLTAFFCHEDTQNGKVGEREGGKKEVEGGREGGRQAWSSQNKISLSSIGNAIHVHVQYVLATLLDMATKLDMF